MKTALLAPAAIGALQTVSRLSMLTSSMRGKVHQINFALILVFPVAMLFLQVSGKNDTLLVLFVILYGVAHGGWTLVRATAVPQYIGLRDAAVLNGMIACWATVGRIALSAPG